MAIREQFHPAVFLRGLLRVLPVLVAAVLRAPEALAFWAAGWVALSEAAANVLACFCMSATACYAMV